MARAIEIAIVEKTMHHPIAKHLVGLKWLWPHVARAARKAALEWMLEPDEGIVKAMKLAAAERGLDLRTPTTEKMFTAAIRHLIERGE
jgi:hypothetical protein